MNMASPQCRATKGPQDRSPFVHFSVCIASDPTSSGVGGSQIGTRFVDFLNREPIAGLTSALTPCGEKITWTRLAGNGAHYNLRPSLATGMNASGRARRRCC
jgi:hypothetical protein